MKLNLLNQSGKELHVVENAESIPRVGEFIHLETRGSDIVGKVIDVKRFYTFRNGAFINIYLKVD